VVVLSQIRIVHGDPLIFATAPPALGTAFQTILRSNGGTALQAFLDNGTALDTPHGNNAPLLDLLTTSFQGSVVGRVPGGIVKYSPR
jgi:hypothetical protein